MSDYPNNENTIPITAEDIRNFDFEEILSRPVDASFDYSNSRVCFNYERHFVDEAKIAANEGNTSRRVICDLFAAVCSFQLTLDGSEPYSPKWMFDGRQSLIPADLPPAYRKLLLEVVQDIKDSELQARVADILWVIREGKYQIAALAVDAYLNSAIQLEDPEHWVEGATRIERALQLASQLGKNGDKYNKTIEHIETLLKKLNGEDPLWLSYKLMSLLLNNGKGEPNTYISLTQKLAENGEKAHDWRRACAYWEILALWYKKEQNETEVYKAQLKAAETYIKEADDHIKQAKPHYLAASYELRYAIEALRRIRAPQEYIQQIHARLLEYQQKDDDFQTVSFSLSIKHLVETATSEVKGKTLRVAILTLAEMLKPPSVDKLREEVLEMQKRYPLAFWVSAQQLNSNGRVTAQRPGLNNQDSQEQAIRAEMYKHATPLQEIVAQGCIIPAIQQINLEHHVRIGDLLEFVKNNPFVPPYHEEIFLQGLYYGFQKDFLIATHLLVPQIENSIRYLLQQQGIITSTLNSQGIQDEYDLGKLLYEVPEVKEIFGEDLTFELQGCLVNRFGSNMRNLIAHGMVNWDERALLRSIYIWGIVLRLCCYPVLIKEKKQNETSSQ